LREQSHRHAALSALLGIDHLILAVNKMDLVGWSRERYEQIRSEFAGLAEKLGVSTVTAIPLCALDGGNVVDPSPSTPWYHGPTLLQHLETLPIPVEREAHLRLPVQLVIKPATGSGGGRWYAGSVAAGVPRVGDEIVVLPSGTRSRIAAVEGNLPAVRVQLADELDVGRGDVIASAEAAPDIVAHVRARVAWMSDKPHKQGAHVIVKHATRSVKAVATILHDRLDVTTLDAEVGVDQLGLNEIGTVSFITSLPLPVDVYAVNRTMGSFIVIDEVTNATIGAGMVTAA
jgi:sulfate adenylyltransferase subunit 1 (EFTu-like GTPase family)